MFRKTKKREAVCCNKEISPNYHHQAGSLILIIEFLYQLLVN
jgi:hypothetical protein